MNRKNSKFSVKNLVLGALFLALALVLPFFTGQIPQIGAMLCPMHLPILLVAARWARLWALSPRCCAW